MNFAQYIGLPFKPRGRGPDGWDCWGLVEMIYEHELGIRLPSYAYTTVDQGHVVATAQEDGYWKEVDEPAMMDVVLLKAMRNPHVGVCVDNQRMLHIPEGKTSCIEYINSPKWKSRIEGFYRYYLCHSTH